MSTPGPWNREWIEGALRHICRNVDSDAFCGEIPKDANTPSYYTPGDVDLIVAAPELLAMCKKLIATCEGLSDQQAMRDDLYMPALQEAYAVIAEVRENNEQT